MNSFLCDTNIISEAMKLQGNTDVVAWLSALPTIHISVITVEEIHYGLAYKEAHRQLEWFERFLESVCTVHDVSPEIAEHCGILRGQLRKKGINKSQADLLIAATAHCNNLNLATRNTKDFDYCGIPLYNPFPL